jgi:hypothetical protein
MLLIAIVKARIHLSIALFGVIKPALFVFFVTKERKKERNTPCGVVIIMFVILYVSDTQSKQNYESLSVRSYSP